MDAIVGLAPLAASRFAIPGLRAGNPEDSVLLPAPDTIPKDRMLGKPIGGQREDAVVDAGDEVGAVHSSSPVGIPASSNRFLTIR